MRDDLQNEGHRRGGRHKGHEGTHQRGAKTFRRGRAIAFLDRMNLKRSTIQQQLDKPEFQSIQPILVGELKAIDMVISEFTQMFEIQDEEAIAFNTTEETERTTNDSEKGV